MPRYTVPMSDDGHEAAVAAWLALNRARQGVLGEIEAALKAAGMPPLAWYDVLLELERAGQAGLRPYRLEPALLLPQYGLSRLLDRIAAAGLLQRRPAPEDRRGHRLVATAAGRLLRRRMWPVYAGALEAALGTHLGAGELEALADLLCRLRRPPPT